MPKASTLDPVFIIIYCTPSITIPRNFTNLSTMNSRPPRYPANARPTLEKKASSSVAMKKPRLSFRPSNGDFLTPPHLVDDKPDRTISNGKKHEADEAAYEIAVLKVALARAKTDARHHANLAQRLRRENGRLQSELTLTKMNEALLLEEKVGLEDEVAYLSDSPTSTTHHFEGSVIDVNETLLGENFSDAAILTLIDCLDLDNFTDDYYKAPTERSRAA